MTGPELVERAAAVAANAYAPYSNYLVGASVLTTDGRLFVADADPSTAQPPPSPYGFRSNAMRQNWNAPS